MVVVRARPVAPPMVAVPSASLDIPATWSALDAGLAAGAPLWRQGPFQRVMAASDSIDDLEHEIAESAESLDSLLQVVEALDPQSTPRSQQRLSSRLAVGVAGRKWAQAEAFADVLSIGHGPIVDWCSGKGHLARVLCHRGCCSSCLLYTSPSPRDKRQSRMPSSA